MASYTPIIFVNGDNKALLTALGDLLDGRTPSTETMEAITTSGDTPTPSIPNLVYHGLRGLGQFMDPEAIGAILDMFHGRVTSPGIMAIQLMFGAAILDFIHENVLLTRGKAGGKIALRSKNMTIQEIENYAVSLAQKYMNVFGKRIDVAVRLDNLADQVASLSLLGKAYEELNTRGPTPRARDFIIRSNKIWPGDKSDPDEVMREYMEMLKKGRRLRATPVTSQSIELAIIRKIEHACM